MKNLFLVFALLSLGGCASEVDKCVAAWENANPTEGMYCESWQRDSKTNQCLDEFAKSRDRVLAEVRYACLQASTGK